MAVAKKARTAKNVIVGGLALLYVIAWLAGIWTLVVLGTLVCGRGTGAPRRGGVGRARGGRLALCLGRRGHHRQGGRGGSGQPRPVLGVGRATEERWAYPS